MLLMMKKAYTFYDNSDVMMKTYDSMIYMI